MTETTTTTGKYLIHETQLVWFKEKMEKLSRKAVKLGMSEITWAWGAEVLKKKEQRGFDTGLVDRYVTVTVTGETPCVKGWTFVATLDHGSEAGTVVRTVPGRIDVVPQEFRTASRFVCSHCNAYRARTETFLVRNDETGELKQVGRNCLADFLGGRDPHKVARQAQFALELAEACEAGAGWGGVETGRVMLSILLATVAAVIRVENDWVSRSAAKKYNEKVGEGGRMKNSTVNMAISTIFAHTEVQVAETKQWRPTIDDFNMADSALTWAKDTFLAKEPETRTDFEHNVAIVVSGETVTYKTMGIAAAVVGMFKRHVDGEFERAARAELGRHSFHLGTVGEWIEASVKVLMTKNVASDWGTSTMYKLITEDGCLMTWFTMSPWEALNQETFTKVRAKVKKHETFREEQQTVVTHVGPPKAPKKSKKTSAAAHG